MLKNSIYSLTSRLFVAFFKFISYIIIAKNLGVKGYGEFVFGMTMMFILTMIILFGYQHSIIRVNSKMKRNNMFNYVSKMYAVLLCFTSIILLMIIGTVILDDILIALAFSIVVSSHIYFLIKQSILMSQNLFKRVIVINLVQGILFILIIIIFTSPDYYMYLFFYGAANFFASLSITDKVQKVNIRYSRFLRIVKLQLKVGFKNLLFEVNNILHNRFDIILLKIMGQDYLLGIYSMVKNFIEALLYLPKAMQPVLLREGTTNKKNINVIKSTLPLDLLLLFIIIIFIFFGNKIIELSFGKEFLEGGVFLIISLIGLLMYSKALVINSYIMGKGLYNRGIYNSSIMSICIVSFNLLFIPLWGLWGATLSYTLCSLIYLYISVSTQISRNNIAKGGTSL